MRRLRTLRPYNTNSNSNNNHNNDEENVNNFKIITPENYDTINYFKLNDNIFLLNNNYQESSLEYQTTLDELVKQRRLFSTRLVYNSCEELYSISVPYHNSKDINTKITPSQDLLQPNKFSNNLNNTIIESKHILSKVAEYKKVNVITRREDHFRMYYLQCSHSGKGYIHWKWNFDESLTISKLLIVLNYALFNFSCSIDWFVSTEKDIEFNQNPDSWKRIPLYRTGTKIYIEKQLDLTPFVKDCNSFHLVVLLDSSNSHSEHAQIFRKSSNQSENNPNPIPISKFDFPFSIDIDLSPKYNSTLNLQKDNYNNMDIQQENNNNNNNNSNGKILNSDLFMKQIYEKVKLKTKSYNDIDPQQWDTNRVCQWLFDNGFYQLIDFFTNEKKTGKDIFTLEKNLIPKDIKKKWKASIQSFNLYLGKPVKNLNRKLYHMCLNDPYDSNSLLRIYKTKSCESDQDSNGNSLVVRFPTPEEFPLILNDKLSSDYQIFVDDQLIYVHKAMLCKWSEYFSALLLSSSHFSESLTNQSKFKSEDLDYNSLLQVLGIMYCENEPQIIETVKQLNISSLFDLFMTSRSLMIDLLVEVFEKVLIWKVDQNNYKDLLELAEQAQATNLFHFCTIFSKLPFISSEESYQHHEI
ncbi:hypothetical protein CYY_001856 [Polysphondylium violaceum]|uniref:BTB domain-containing protein n=1 Tax=Polysphondylium violaceum TaxID=133409 RepID=A0A8J4V3H8_9MYCE|nr:hypothetical protein CYY_001856 [Polysphondylium violaceum]